MATHVDNREDLEPGAGQTSATPPAGLIGLDVSDPFAGFGDYFGFDEEDTWYFPDGKQWIKFKKMNEGMRARFMRATRPDVTVNQKSGDAKIPFDQAAERRELILASVTDWLVVRRNPRTNMMEPVPFSGGNSAGGNLAQWLNSANPAIVSQLEKAIRKANPWMMNEMTAEQIRKEITDLEELLEAAVAREAREESFQEAG
jgi:hypothetical protein